jgi:hypothetical protein
MTLLLARQQCFVAATKWRDKAQPYKNYIFFPYDIGYEDDFYMKIVELD